MRQLLRIVKSNLKSQNVTLKRPVVSVILYDGIRLVKLIIVMYHKCMCELVMYWIFAIYAIMQYFF